MSEGVYSNSAWYEKVKREHVEMEEKDEGVYGNVERPGKPAVTKEQDVYCNGGDRHVESVPPMKGSYKASVVCLGLLCVLLLAGIIGLGLHHWAVTDENIRESELKNARYKNISDMVLNQISRNKNLAEVVQEKNTLVKNLAEVVQQKNTLVKNLAEERDELLRKTKMCCQDWQKFDCNWYYISSEKKTWEESRRDCRERGADLVIINTREERDFVLSFNKHFWIGLTDSDVEGEWKWVDGSPLSDEHRFWRSGEPNDANQSEDCAEQLDSALEGGWNDLHCDQLRHWVCEKIIVP